MQPPPLDAQALIIYIFVIRFERVEPLSAHSLFGYFLQNFDLVVCSFQIMWCTLLYFKRNIGFVLEVTSEPDSRKVAPPELLHDHISVLQNFANVNWVIAEDL